MYSYPRGINAEADFFACTPIANKADDASVSDAISEETKWADYLPNCKQVNELREGCGICKDGFVHVNDNMCCKEGHMAVQVGSILPLNSGHQEIIIRPEERLQGEASTVSDKWNDLIGPKYNRALMFECVPKTMVSTNSGVNLEKKHTNSRGETG